MIARNWHGRVPTAKADAYQTYLYRTGANDGWLWVKTRFELATADDLRDSTINVDVDKGVVTLTGTVASAAQKTRAEAVAKSVDGVTGVKNQLKVQAANANAPKANANK